MTSNVIPSTPFTPSHPAASDTAAKVGNAAGNLAVAVSHAGALIPAAAPGGVSTDFTSELNNIDFKKMIGGPLQAAVDAQVASALATVDFIQKVGFTQPLGTDGQPDLTKPRAGHGRVLAQAH